MEVNRSMTMLTHVFPVLYRFYEARLLDDVIRGRLPRHLGLIQDGHRRYAREAGLSNLNGYRLGAAKAESAELVQRTQDPYGHSLVAFDGESRSRLRGRRRSPRRHRQHDPGVDAERIHGTARD